MRFFSIVFLCVILYGAPKEYAVTSVSQLQQKYISVITPHFDKVPLRYFQAADGTKIAYKIFKIPHPKAQIVIVSGRTESMLKYKELIYDLTHNGYSVYIVDHRGQGFSQRALQDMQIGHVQDFYTYVDDLKYFVENFVPRKPKRILLAHSMGGAIASLYIEHYKHDFDGAVLSSPMHQPGDINAIFHKKMCSILNTRRSDFNRYAPFTSSYDTQDKSFKNNHLTHSRVRYDIALAENEKYPQTKIGGPSLQWVAQACRWSAISIKDAKKIMIPVLLLQATKDSVVSTKAQERFCQNIKKSHCELVKIDRAYHEIFIEKDKYRTKALSEILDFLSRVSYR